MEQKIICGIYKITSPTMRIYIGKAKDILKRWGVYKKLNCKSQPKLYRSLKKHGVESHTFEIICECEEHELNEKEIFYIKEFDACDREKGLNLKKGGDGGGWTDEVKEKASIKATQWQTGRTLSKDHAQNIGKTNKKIWENSTEEEKKKRTSGFIKFDQKTDEQKQKMIDGIREWHRNNKRPPESDETKKKKSEKSKKMWEEKRDKIIESQKGERDLTDEQRKNYSNASIKRGKNRKNNPKYESLYAKQKRKRNNKGEKNPMYGKHYPSKHKKIILNFQTGIYYDSLKELSSFQNVSIAYLSEMLNNKKFNKTNFHYV